MRTLESAIAEARREGSPLHTHFQNIVGMRVGLITEWWHAELMRLICLGAIQSGAASLDYYSSDLFLAVLAMRDGVYRWRDPAPAPAATCTGVYDDGMADGNLTRCSKREGCGLAGCPQSPQVECSVDCPPGTHDHDDGTRVIPSWTREPCKARWGAWECARVGPHDMHAAEGGLTSWDDAARTDRNVIDVPVRDAAPGDANVAACGHCRVCAPLVDDSHGVYIVTTDNGRVHSAHWTEADAVREHARAVNAEEIHATGVEWLPVQGGSPVAAVAAVPDDERLRMRTQDDDFIWIEPEDRMRRQGILLSTGVSAAVLTDDEALELARMLTVAVQRRAGKAGGK